VHDKTIRRRRAVLVLLVAVSLILLTDYFGESPSSPLHQIQRGIVEVLSPVQDGASKVLSPVRDVAGWFSSMVHAKSEVTRLRAENESLTKQVAQANYDWSHYKQDQDLLGLDSANGLKKYDPLAANVISRNPLAWYQTLEVDKGSDDGVKQYDPVVGGGGLVGDVYRVGATYSIVNLLTSPSFSVGAQVENEAGDQGELGPKVGDQGALLLSYLPSDAEVATGQEVVTSGFKDSSDPRVQSFAPGGIPIGTVSNENTQNTVQVNGQVDVQPYADLTHLDVVQILTNPHATS